MLELRDGGKLAPPEDEWLREKFDRLEIHLRNPTCLAEPDNLRAIYWFPPRAKRPIEKMRSIAASLREHGVPVALLKSADPGIVVYADGWQVVAKPRRKRGGAER